MESGTTAAERADLDESIIVALGGNLASAGRSSLEVLEAAIAALPRVGLAVRRRSQIWRSAAWPDPSEPVFLNAVVQVATPLDAEQTLAALHALEAEFGRIRLGTNAPRTLDADLVAYGRLVRPASPILPHPRAAERLFVMGPLAEIAPAWRHPQTGRSAASLALRATVGADAGPLASRE